jgi:hypothetical protein
LFGGIFFVIVFGIGTAAGILALFFLPLSFIVAVPAFALGNLILKASKVGIVVTLIGLAGTAGLIGWSVLAGLIKHDFSLVRYDSISPIPLMIITAGNTIMFAFLIKGWHALKKKLIVSRRTGRARYLYSAQFLSFLFFFTAISGIFTLNYIIDLNRGNGKFDSIGGIAVDESGVIYAADPDTHRVLKFDGTGNFSTSWSSDANRIAISKDGSLYTVNDGIEITKYSNSGKKIAIIGGSSSHSNGTGTGYRDIAINSNGDIFVIDASAKILHFNNNGDFVDKWDLERSPNDNLTKISPLSIAIDKENSIYALQAVSLWRPQYKAYEMNGAIVLKFKSSSSNSPCEVETVNSSDSCLVSRLDIEGRAIDVDPEYIYTSDFGRIYKYTQDGVLVKRFETGLQSGSDIDVGLNGFLYAGDDGEDTKFVNKYSRDGVFISKVGGRWHPDMRL